MTTIKNIAINQIKRNNGQLEGLPKNPRIIRDERFEALKKSIQDAPEMLNLRELLVYPYEDKYIVIGGNMRLRACQDLGYKEVPCKVLPVETPVVKLREYAIKDNEGFGQNDWDLLSNDWDSDELRDWGVITIAEEFDEEDIDRMFEATDTERIKDCNFKISIPKEKEGEMSTLKKEVTSFLSEKYPYARVL